MQLSQEDVSLMKMIRENPPGSFNILPYDLALREIPETIHKTIIDAGNGNNLFFRNARVWSPSVDVQGVRRVKYPQYARERGETYGAEITAEAVIGDRQTGVERSSMTFLVGVIPMMTHSNYCHLRGLSPQQLAEVGEDPNDIKGYFIVGGNEYVVLSQEQLVLDRILLIRPTSKDPPTARMQVVNSDKITSMCVVARSRKGHSIKYRFQSLGKYKRTSSSKGAAYRGVNFMYLFHALGYVHLSAPEIIEQVMRFIPSEEKNKCLIVLGPAVKEYLANPDHIKFFRSRFLAPEKKKKKDDQNTAATAAPEISDDEIRSQIRQLMYYDFFVHCNSIRVQDGEDVPSRLARIYAMKLNLLCIMVAELARHMAGFRPLDDRDSWSNKRTRGAGDMMGNLFRTAWRKEMKDLVDHIGKGRAFTDVNHLQEMLNSPIITNSFRDSFVTGGWGVKGSHIKNNVAQILASESGLARIAHVNTVDVSVSRTEKGQQMRIIQNSQYGYIDPIATPEGNNAGLVKTFAALVKLSHDTPEELLDIRILGNPEVGIPSLVSQDKAAGFEYPILVNGKFYGWCEGRETVNKLVTMRRAGQINYNVTIVMVDRYVYVDSSAARPMRPIFILDADGVPLVEKLGLMDEPSQVWLDRGVMEYVSPWEQEWLDIAPEKKNIAERFAYAEELRRNIAEIEARPEADRDHELLSRWGRELAKIKPFTHVEISPLSYMSCVSCCIPWPDHNQAPRNTYQFGMSKQALNHSLTRAIRSSGSKTKTLLFSQRPLVSTPMFEALNLNNSGAGENVYVAFQALPGTEEDSFVMKQEYLERGGFLNMQEFTVSTIIRHTDTPQEILAVPNTGNPAKYAHLYNKNPDAKGVIDEDFNGLPIEGSLVKDDDCIIGKIQVDGQTNINTSIFLTYGERGIVSKVTVYKDRNSVSSQIIVQIRGVRIPSHGDKFAARNAQKGTLGYAIPERFLPFDERGVVPDIFANPHCIPSRMTISYLFEVLASTTAAFTGETINGEAFAPTKYLEHSEVLRGRNYDPFCNNMMRSGSSGIPLARRIFSGMVFMQELKYQALDKEQSRDTGKFTEDVRQPTKGRGRRGGLRFGEMERDALISHGASNALVERLMEVSDPYPAFFCADCGSFAVNHKDWFETCHQCGNSTNFCKKTVPYAWKYLHDLLMTLGMNLAPVFESADENNKRMLRTLQAEEGEFAEEEMAEDADEEKEEDEGEFEDEPAFD